ncbi:MAG: beta-ketoacyl-ACP synthase II [Actinomycetota bacterium]|nr:beta-ketoacyl-ACP synthase II [Actinomycetota bacterium]
MSKRENLETAARRVVITGMGVVSPVGIGKEKFWASLINGRSGIGQITLFDAAEYPVTIAGEVTDFDISDKVEPKELRHLDRFVQFAIKAADEAIEDSGINIAANAARVGVIVGSGIGGLRTLEDQHIVLRERGPRRVSPFLIPMMIPDLAAGQISIYFGAKGPNFCPVSACATATHAVGEAFETIRRGAADACIAGGAEAPITPLGVAGFAAMKALSTRNDEPQKASRPFDAKRDGFIIGEGSGIVVLEELEAALSRGANIYAELVGYGATGDAYHITAPDVTGSGAARSMTIAIEQAGLTPLDVDYVNAHGTSTPANDKLETLATKMVFGEAARSLLISSTKSMTGHLLGAAGAVELVASVLTIESGIVPPTINQEYPDPDCDLNYVPNEAVEAKVGTALSNSFGFGGHNASIVVRKWTG